MSKEMDALEAMLQKANHRGKHSTSSLDDIKPGNEDLGWKPPRTDAEASKRFFDKHGRSSWNEAIDKRWRSLGRKIAKGSRIDSGMLRSSRRKKDSDE